uniref:EH domain containing 2 n=1 Tax=Leptobrachium leishanense TaxID=445787 RepID=A0A8C5QEN3_9ANUR
MFSWMGKNQKNKETPEVIHTVTEGLKDLYKKKLKPVEDLYRFHDFHSPALEDADFDNKPMVLVVGQYSTGKTTFIKYLLEQDIPGSRIGPEPTTDSFIAVMHGETEGVIPGNALMVDPNKPFRKLSPFGNTFLNRFMCAHLPNKVLESISMIDTPGILSGTKQRVCRGYDFPAVLQWFAERVDRIILLFDAHKLEISDEFSEAIQALNGNEDKIRVVLNKADMVETQQLMRVYGALMWSLGKVFNTPEVLRVYIGSFWAEPLMISDNRRLFELEEQDLFQDIQNLPRNSALRKLNDLVKRARLVRVHAHIISHLKKEMPVFRKDNKKKQLINMLPVIFAKIQLENHISPGDFPDYEKMQVSTVNRSQPGHRDTCRAFTVQETPTITTKRILPPRHQIRIAICHHHYIPITKSSSHSHHQILPAPHPHHVIPVTKSLLLKNPHHCILPVTKSPSSHPPRHQIPIIASSPSPNPHHHILPVTKSPSSHPPRHQIPIISSSPSPNPHHHILPVTKSPSSHPPRHQIPIIASSPSPNPHHRILPVTTSCITRHSKCPRRIFCRRRSFFIVFSPPTEAADDPRFQEVPLPQAADDRRSG